MASRYTYAMAALVAATAPLWGQTLPSYTISTIAGNGTQGYSGDGGAATAAELYNPRGIVSDPAGDVYFCDFNNNRVREILTNGTIVTVAGTGVAGYNGDNIQGTKAELWEPYRVSMDPAGNLYIADPGNNRIRKLAPNGIITTVAGNGNSNYTGDGGLATSAALDFAEDAVLDTAGNIYIADSGNNAIRKVTAATGIITTIAGTGSQGYSGDGGQATKATLYLPVSLAVDPAGNIYFSDQGNNVVRKVTAATGIITTIAGSTALGFGGDGGPATAATFNNPAGVALDSAGNLYVIDVANCRLRVILTTGTIQTVAGNGNCAYGGDGGPATSGELNEPRSVAVGTFGDVYIADFSNNRVRQLTPGATTVGLMVNAFGNIKVLAENTWMVIKGTDLAPDTRAWEASDFINGQMPTSLDGVSVTLNGTSAYVYYISPTQVNVLTPPNLAAGEVSVQVDNNGNKSAVAYVQAQQYSPTFFEFGAGPYVVGVHLNGTDIGPTSLYPGLTTPAQPGETVVLFANGFGATSAAIVSGSSSQSGNLPALPVVTIGGITATVQFAGLVSPGLYQFNVVVPSNAPAGDNTITASYNGLTTQPGVLITVQ
jgi:uncharacterized protein (TIGR03437 family)